MDATKCIALLLFVLAPYAQAGLESPRIPGATSVKLRWTRKAGLAASLPRGGGRSFSRTSKQLRVCSGDQVQFVWSGEESGLFLMENKSDYDRCSKSNLNFVKNNRPSGSFYTKANNAGWRYYVYIPSGGTCSLKIAIYWDESC